MPTTTTQAPTTTAPLETVRQPRFVDSSECTTGAIARDTGERLVFDPFCAGAWAIGNTSLCGPDSACERVEIFRYTTAGWQFRGGVNQYCVWSVADSGMPFAINDVLLGFNYSCFFPITFFAEPAVGDLALGHQGSRVVKLQQRLIELDLLDDVADGRYGPNTQSAVIDFQFLAGLPPYGLADFDTHQALGVNF